MHTVLARQLRSAGAGPDGAPEPGAWRQFLEAVSRAYTQADQDRYLLERSLALSSVEMQELHAALRAERDAISSVTCSLGEGVCALDEDGVIEFVNPEGVRLLGLESLESAKGRRLTELVRARDTHDRPLEVLLQQRASADGDGERLVIAGDESAFIVYQLRALVGERAGLVLTLRDISERRRHEREREELNRRLVDVSRRAGMAEVASGVLHNVGNVLNSVGVSATMASERLRRTRLVGLERASDLLERNSHRLAQFVTEDPAGQRLPEYLAALAEALGEDVMAADRELQELQRSVAHIKEVIGAQLSLTRVSGVRDSHRVAELVDEALRLVQCGLDRHGVRVKRELPAVDVPVVVQRHEVLQILVNLFTNAKQAMSDNPPGERRLTVRATRGENGANVRIDVVDTGKGIDAAAMPKIFSHGFTTRKDGHGFGLHISALSAKSMGGALRAASEGAGRGSTFTLELPITPQRQGVTA